ncbi:MAG: hypothetical protein ACREMF_01850 [Gemmatimonadales bacterium]
MLARARVVRSVASLLGLTVACAVTASAQARNVVVNEVRIADGQLQALERQYGTRIPDGAYWYDRSSGAWGMRGGPTAGFTVAGLSLGGPLRPDASSGTTGVFINGRQLHVMDVLGLQQLIGAVYPGRYWVDAQGNAGFEGGPALVNLVVMARQRGARSGGGGGAYSVYNRLGGMFGSDGSGCLVYADRDVSYSSSGC